MNESDRHIYQKRARASTTWGYRMGWVFSRHIIPFISNSKRYNTHFLETKKKNYL